MKVTFSVGIEVLKNLVASFKEVDPEGFFPHKMINKDDGIWELDAPSSTSLINTTTGVVEFNGKRGSFHHFWSPLKDDESFKVIELKTNAPNVPIWEHETALVFHKRESQKKLVIAITEIDTHLLIDEPYLTRQVLGFNQHTLYLLQDATCKREMDLSMFNRGYKSAVGLMAFYEGREVTLDEAWEIMSDHNF